MSIVKMPFIGFQAGGDLASAITYRGRQLDTIACEKVNPTNPRTGPQQSNRQITTKLNQIWKNLRIDQQSVDAYEAMARYYRLKGGAYHAFIQNYKTNWKIAGGLGVVFNPTYSVLLRFRPVVPPGVGDPWLNMGCRIFGSCSDAAVFNWGIGGTPLNLVAHKQINVPMPAPFYFWDFSYFGPWPYPDIALWFYPTDAYDDGNNNSGFYITKNIPWV